MSASSRVRASQWQPFRCDAAPQGAADEKEEGARGSHAAAIRAAPPHGAPRALPTGSLHLPFVHILFPSCTEHYSLRATEHYSLREHTHRVSVQAPFIMYKLVGFEKYDATKMVDSFVHVLIGDSQ